MSTAKKLDLPRVGQPRIVMVPRTTHLTLSGKGLPGGKDGDATSQLQKAIAALYGLAYTIKFARRKRGGPELQVGAVEADWWVPGKRDLRSAPREAWRWQLFLPVPGVKRRELAEAAQVLEERGRGGPLVARAELVEAPATRCAEALHIGPYDAESPTIEAMTAHARAQGWKLTGHHREVYLGDPRRSAPARLKTLLRHPVVRATAQRRSLSPEDTR
jgi:hypothetical protein